MSLYMTEGNIWNSMLEHFQIFNDKPWPFPTGTGWKKLLHDWLNAHGGSEIDHKCINDW